MTIRTLLVPALVALGLAGACEGNGKVDRDEIKAEARDAGQELKSAAKDAGDAVEDAAQKGVAETKKAASKAKDALRDHPDRSDTVRPRDAERQ